MQSKPIEKGKLIQEFGYVPERLDKQLELPPYYTKDN